MIPAANAQYAPEKGDFSVEIGFNPFNTGSTFNLLSNSEANSDQFMLKGRYFLSGKDALRLKLNLGVESTTETTETSFNPEYVDGVARTLSNGTAKNIAKNTDFSFAIGYERHFTTFKRVDIYAGAQLGYGISKWSGEKNEESKSERYDNDNNLDYTITSSSVTKYTNYNGGSRFSSKYFNVGAFTGIDFYVYKGLYLGAELGLSFTSGTSPDTYYTQSSNSKTTFTDTNIKDITTSMESSTETGITVTTDSGYKNGDPQTSYAQVENKKQTNNNFKFYVEPVIRLGWRF